MATTADKKLSLSIASLKLVEELMALSINRRLFNNQSQLFRMEVPIEDIEVLSWLAEQKSVCKIFWEDRNKDFSVAGIGAADQISAKTIEDCDVIISQIKKKLSKQFPTLQYFGGFSFNAHNSSQGEWGNWPKGQFVLPQVEVRKTSAGMILACNIILDNKFEQRRALLITTLENLQETKTFNGNLMQSLRRHDIPDELTWKSSAAYITNSINLNRFEKVVLARSVRLDFNSAINPFVLMNQLQLTAENCYCYIFQFQNGESFVGASPERLYRRCEQIIFSEAVAGTRPRGEKLIQDSLNQNNLLSSTKDNKEQKFVVEMIHDKLKSLCIDFRADQEPSLLNWGAGHHLISRFDGHLKENVGDQNILASLHPTPAVAGTPTALALKEINQIENFDRGWYCGPVGYIGALQSEFVVAIRSSLLRDKSVYLYAGAGIIKESSPDAEWEETENKLSNFLKIFNADKN